jgi:hypothetical protein
MVRCSSANVVTVAVAAIFCAGCFPSTGTTGGGGGGGGGTGLVAPTLEVTISGVHFGPAAPDPGATASLVTTRDPSGQVSGTSFRMSATIGTAGCALAFDRFGPTGTIGVGAYAISADVAAGSSPDGQVYPTGAERVSTPEGGAGCTGTDCTGGTFVLSAVDAAHVTGYAEATMSADSGAGVADVVCTFWIPSPVYQP